MGAAGGSGAWSAAGLGGGRAGSWGAEGSPRSGRARLRRVLWRRMLFASRGVGVRMPGSPRDPCLGLAGVVSILRAPLRRAEMLGREFPLNTWPRARVPLGASGCSSLCARRSSGEMRRAWGTVLGEVPWFPKRKAPGVEVLILQQTRKLGRLPALIAVGGLLLGSQGLDRRF